MAKIILKKRKSTDNFGDVYIRYIKDKKQKVFSLNLTITEIDFNNLFVKENINQFKKTTKFNYKEINKLIIDNIDKDVFSSTEKDPITLISYFNKQIPLIPNSSTRVNYTQTLKNLTTYLTTINKLDINFEEIDRDLIKKYKLWLRDVKKNKPNSISQNLTLIRAMLNVVSEDNNIDYKLDPYIFKKLINRTSTPKKDMPTMDDIKKILTLKPTDKHYMENNMFLLGVSLGGIRASDLFFLKYSDFKDDYVSVFASKTKKRFEIPYNTLTIRVLAKILNVKIDNIPYIQYVNFEMQEIYPHSQISDLFKEFEINISDDVLKENVLGTLKNQSPNEYILKDFLNTEVFNDYSKITGMNEQQQRVYGTKRTRYNERLTEICKLNKLTINKMTSHYSRYVAVMILIEGGLDIIKISKILQHSKIQQTIDYIQNNYTQEYLKEASAMIGKPFVDVF